jgi:hypothetical protein
MDMMRDSISDILEEVVGVRPIQPAPRLNATARAIPKTNARPPHPPYRCAPQARARLPYAGAAPSFCPSAPLRRLWQSRAIRRRACAHRNRWWCGDEAGRSLRRSSVHDLPCETASDRRAYLLVRAPHRSSQCGLAAVDYISRYKGRGAHCLSGATADQSGEGIWLRATPSPEQIFATGIDDF